MSEYGRTSGSYATVYPVGISACLQDARGERIMVFHGDGLHCDNELQQRLPFNEGNGMAFENAWRRATYGPNVGIRTSYSKPTDYVDPGAGARLFPGQ